jgi:hypothetical protein
VEIEPERPVGEQFITAIIAALALAAVVLAFVVWRGRAATRARRTLQRQSPGDDQSIGKALASLDVDRPEEAG